MKFGICNEIFQGWKIEDVFRYAARTGYDGVEIAPFTLAKSVTDISALARRELRQSAARESIAITGIHWVLVQTEGLHLTHPDRAVRQKTADYFCDLVDFCADIGGTRVIVGSPKQRNLLEGVSRESAWNWAKEVFQASVRRAGERGVVICFEPLAPSETNFVNTAEQAVSFAREMAADPFRIILDVKAMSSEGRPIPEIIRAAWPWFAYFHANDRNLKGPGFGDVDFRPIAGALREVGYEGWVSVEVFNFEEGPEVIATKSLDYLKKVF